MALMKNKNKNKSKRLQNNWIFYNLLEEKGNPLGFEPVAEFLPSVRFKSWNNMGIEYSPHNKNDDS